ncbi:MULTISPECIES: exodeoxyribonuclease VII small subunit [unclassified Devosia]|mgnify:CR=1 FL=1|jgi:exodeoxyribonuclease VII small subunit|uniref:exodeoxyribonuclease VII small subunit n=1 Tax=unclassified Devosia TaxID=196773 RepID=UPI00086F62E1|nr:MULTISPECIES: exodeoxyribonuclease VII small subunit [unclassified Devosia]MBN9362482.1 exodeoxyribonuclease VII small subunit [Devosia sp.]ODS95005.1 MAG: exodeoxyribonuclease VII small subunit [Devosia sp. SCN 66-27]OJX24292.1 MAG: exodeoxyribonuclease VII small subunit [Devosia sp. 66-14]HEV2514861.1 exodeoxyribonuclease VII small subunit [Devosia sp.]
MADSPAPADDIKLMSFEAALRELEGIVGKLESGQAPLAESIAIYERGEALKAHCEALLKQAEMRIEKITLRNGQPTGTEPLDPQ